MDNLPDTIQWLLDFANLGCKPGEINPSRIYKPPEVKRQPVAPPDINLTNQGQTPSVVTGEMCDPWLRIYSRAEELLPSLIKDDKDCFWSKTQNGQPIFIGTKSIYPSLSEFKNFFLNNGIPPEKLTEIVKFEKQSITDEVHENFLFLKEDKGGKNIIVDGEFVSKKLFKVKESEWEAYLDLKMYTNVVFASFYHMMQLKTNIFTELKYAYERYTKQSGNLDIQTGTVTFKHDNTLPLAIYAFILDFWINHKELHSYLRQCKCCGEFWIEQKNRERGRKRIFCSEDCKRIFHQQSRSDNLKAVKIKRDRLKEKKQKEDYSQLIELLLKNDYTQKEAKEESFEWIYKKEKSFKEFKRTRAVSYGLK